MLTGTYSCLICFVIFWFVFLKKIWFMKCWTGHFKYVSYLCDTVERMWLNNNDILIKVWCKPSVQGCYMPNGEGGDILLIVMFISRF